MSKIFFSRLKTLWARWSTLLLIASSLSLFLIFRFTYLDSIPASLTHDEMIYVVQARALALTGTDLAGTWNPLSLRSFHADFAELPAVLMAPATMLISQPVLAARMTHVLILGLALPFVLGWLASVFFGKKTFFWPTTFLAMINPWIWQVSRMSFDPPLGLFFYLLGAVLMLRGGKWAHFFAPVVMILGFFQYQGLKLILLPWMGLWYGLWFWRQRSAWQPWLTHRAWRKLLRLVAGPAASLLIAVLVFAWYVFISLPQQTAAVRVQKIIFTDRALLSEVVQTQRRVSMASPWQKLVSNKGVALLEFMSTRYAQSLSPEMLFLHGEANLSPFSAWSHGFFYALDAVFILFGLSAFWQSTKQKQSRWALLLAMAIAPFPALVSTTNNWFFFRASLLYMLLLLLAGYGLTQLWQSKQTWLKGLVVAGYGLCVLLFAYQYFLRYPVYAADGQFFQERLIASYIQRQSPETQIVVHTPSPGYAFNSYLFYAKKIQPDTIQSIRQAMGDPHRLQFENVEFTDGCLLPETFGSKVVIAEISMGECDRPQMSDKEKAAAALAPVTEKFNFEAAISIPSLRDSGEMFRIYNDKVCQPFALQPFIAPQSIDLFAVEKLDNQLFCQSWLTDLRPLRMKTVATP